MSPAASADPPPDTPGRLSDHVPGAPLRLQFSAELDQLRLQTEVMGVRVDENLERMRQILQGASLPIATKALAADDEIDAMNASLTERCYDVLARESPKAGDLRLVVSVIRVIAEFERVGDLSLRVVKLAPEIDLLRTDDRTFDILCVMADEAVELFRVALRAWATEDQALATELAAGSASMDLYHEQLTEALLRLSGPDAVVIAIRAFQAGRALERIADHASLIGTRVRYLVTGDPDHLATEAR